MRPRIALIPGDPSGIGPELTAKLLAKSDITEKSDILLIGDECVIEMGKDQAGCDFFYNACNDVQDDRIKSHGLSWQKTSTIPIDNIKIAHATKESGASTLETLNRALDYAKQGIVDGILFAPFNKQAMHLAGIGFDDELHYMAHYLNVDNYFCEVNTFDNMWTSRVTSHIALKDVASDITEYRVTNSIMLINQLLKNAGISRPRIAVAALNPHAGDGGNFGREEVDIIRPAVDKMKEQQINVDGPWPSDTVFLKVKAHEVDAVVTMYHDQGQIALKLMGFDKGVTVQGGIPYPITTPAHGTAFDIAGKGMANVSGIYQAFLLLCDMAEHWGK